MPHLELTELEAKVGWMILDQWRSDKNPLEASLKHAEFTLFAKMYRASRGMPPEKAA